MEETKETKKEESINTEELSEELQSYLTFKTFIKSYIANYKESNKELTIDEIIDVCFRKMVEILRYRTFDTSGSLYEKCAKYLELYHSPAENDFQAAILITAWKAFIAGAKTRPGFTLKYVRNGRLNVIKDVVNIDWNGSFTEDGKIARLDYETDVMGDSTGHVSSFSISMDS